MTQGLEFEHPLTSKDKAEFLEQAAVRATDEKPLWINLQHAEILPWAAKGKLVPQRGTFVKVIYEEDKRGKIPQAIVVDFTRTSLINDKIQYARLPLAAVEINGLENKVWVDCTKAVEIRTMPHFNFFIEKRT